MEAYFYKTSVLSLIGKGCNFQSIGWCFFVQLVAGPAPGTSVGDLLQPQPYPTDTDVPCDLGLPAAERFTLLET